MFQRTIVTIPDQAHKPAEALDNIIPDMVTTESNMETNSTVYQFIAQPLQSSASLFYIHNTFKSVHSSLSSGNCSESKGVAYTYESVNADANFIPSEELEFDISEEIVDNGICDDGIAIDKISYPEHTNDTLALCSILDHIPGGNHLIGGNVDIDDIQLYLECSDDNENTINDCINTYKSSHIIAEATSQIKMDTQFKISFPLVPERGLKCSICKTIFLSQDFLREHTVNKHGSHFQFCDFCRYFTKSKKFFETHLKTRHDKYLLSIETDHSRYNNCVTVSKTDTLRQMGHMSNECAGKDLNDSERNGYECNKHSCMSNTLGDCKIVDYVRKPEYTVACELCKFVTKSNRLLNNHQQAMHNPNRKIFQCLDCSYACLQRRTFVSHLKRHTGVFEFHCKTCDKRFVSKHLLTKHSRTHRETLAMANTDDVGEQKDVLANVLLEDTDRDKINSKNASTQTKLSKHYKQNFNCIKKSSCNEISDGKESMKTYEEFMKRAQCKKIFDCTFNGCNKTFRDSFNLRKHICVHTKTKTMKCPHCSFQCIQNSSLSHHIKSKHK